MGCATGIVKNLVFLLNFLCSIVGLTLIVLGSIALVSLNRIDAVAKQSNTFVPSFILAIGVFIFVVSFLGCCGVCQRSQWMLTTYAVILLLLFVIQLALGIYGFVQISKSDNNSTKQDMENQFEHYFQSYQNESVKEFFNDFQRQLECCGAVGPIDYDKLRVPYPGSCCGLNDNEICVTPYQTGCSEKLYDFVLHSLKVISYVALGICATEIVAALFAICLVNSYRNESRRGL